MEYQPLLTLNWNLLFSLITVVVLIFILRKFFFQKVHDFMENRQKEIEDQLQNAADTTKEAEALKAEYESQLSKAEEEGEAIITEARNTARAEADKVIKEAHTEAARIREDNEVAMQQRKEETIRELENEVSDLAILAARKILETNATEAGTGIKGDTLTDEEEMAIRRQLDELKIHMNQEN